MWKISTTGSCDWRETNTTTGETRIEGKCGKIKRTGKFKYIGERIQPNGLDKEANNERTR